MLNSKTLIFTILLICLATATWDVQGATSKVCFNLSSSPTYYKTNPYSSGGYGMGIISIPINTSVPLTTPMLIYHNSNTYDVYKASTNATHQIFFTPIISTSKTYCIYSGASSKENLANIPPVYYANVTSNKTLASWTSTTSVSAIAKGNCSTTSNYSKIIYGALELPLNATHTFSRMYGSTGGWFSKYIYDVNFTDISSGVLGLSSATSLRYATNCIQPTEYVIAYRENYSGTAITYEAVDTGIQILSPAWNAEVSVQDTIMVQTNFLTAYDNCTAYINNIEVGNYSSISIGTPQYFFTNTFSIGSNELKVSCMASGAETHQYSYFTVKSQDVGELFSLGLNTSIDACPALTQTALASTCSEYYNINTEQSFGAVVCKNLNLSTNLTCLSTYSNYTKNQGTANYTIFYTPSSFHYANTTSATSSSEEHMGASFHYGGVVVDGGIEIYGNNKFVYLPAQTPDRDCSVFYINKTWCSWYRGFIINNGTIYVADRTENQWYKSPGTGIVGFGTNFSQVVIDVSLLLVTQPPTNVSSFYTRVSCYTRNGTYYANIASTLSKTFTITTITSTNESSVVSFNSTSVSYNIPTTNLTAVAISDGSQTLCYYGNGMQMFIPFNISFLNLPIYNIFIWIAFIFSVIVSVIIPFALFIPLLLNDAYHLLTLEQMAQSIILVVLGGFVVNAKAYNRGIKHLVLITFIVISFLVIMQNIVNPYLNGATIISDDITKMTNDLSMTASQISSGDSAQMFVGFTLGSFTVLIDIIVFLVKLPLILTDGLIAPLLYLLNPQLATQALMPLFLIRTAMIIYLMIKAFEVLSNRFRDV